MTAAEDEAARRRAERARTIAYLDLDEGRGPVPILDPDEIAEALRAAKRIAVIGASSRPSRPSFGVFRYLLDQGYDCVPVNPRETKGLDYRETRTDADSCCAPDSGCC